MDNKELYDERFAHIKDRLDDHEERLSEVEDKTSKMDISFHVSFAKTSAALEKLSELPQAINSIQKTNEDVRLTLVQLSGKVDNLGADVNKLDRKVCNLNEKVEASEEEDKFSIKKFLKDNWVAIIIGVALFVAYGSYRLKDIVGLFD